MFSLKTFPDLVSLALEWKKMLDSGKYLSQVALARQVGVSRVHQMLRLLKLPPDIQKSVIRMGDPLPSRKITEHKLRALLASPQSK